MSDEQNDPMARLADLNTALVASRIRAEGSRAQGRDKSAHGSPALADGKSQSRKNGAAAGGAARQSEKKVE